MSRFVIRAVSSGVKFDLRAHNGQTIATSEVYGSIAACRRGIESVRKYAPVAGVENLTETDSFHLKHPKFELFQDKSCQYRFRLKAANGRVIAVSEGYAAKAGCLNGIACVQKNAPGAEITEE